MHSPDAPLYCIPLLTLNPKGQHNNNQVANQVNREYCSMQVEKDVAKAMGLMREAESEIGRKKEVS